MLLELLVKSKALLQIMHMFVRKEDRYRQMIMMRKLNTAVFVVMRGASRRSFRGSRTSTLRQRAGKTPLNLPWPRELLQALSSRLLVPRKRLLPQDRPRRMGRPRLSPRRPV